MPERAAEVSTAQSWNPPSAVDAMRPMTFIGCIAESVVPPAGALRRQDKTLEGMVIDFDIID
jgi:hypothetical protein